MITAGQYHVLKVVKKVEFGLYLDAEGTELLLPKRFAPKTAQPGDALKVFVYHDSENRLIATTQEPKGIVGDIVALHVVSVTRQGAFLDWGLMKDLFLPASQQRVKVLKGQSVPVLIYIDQQTGRAAATEKFGHLLSNDELSVKEKDEVDLFVYRKTELGYEVIVNNKHLGLMHSGDVFGSIRIGDRLKGFIKKIRTDNKIDVMPGQSGYKRVENETDKILRLLQENNDYLPYDDKSEPEKIYDFFGMSKKTFKMAIGALYKQRKISFGKNGIVGNLES
ncbi:MAG TPA: S1-like domain-containing RNA-binding protein [Puia sp.]|nr:S1-like domain-containing RNA-binding protein [Puia sp.]